MPVPTGRRGDSIRHVDTAKALTAGSKGRAFILHPDGTGGGQPPNAPSWGNIQTDQGTVAVDDPGSQIWGIASHDYSVGDSVAVIRRGEVPVEVTTMEVLSTTAAGSFLRMNSDGSFGQAHASGTANTGGYGVVKVQEEFTSTQLSAAGGSLMVLGTVVENPEWVAPGGGG